MTEQELRQGYEQEISYQKRMMDNLGRWCQLAFLLASIGVVFLYFSPGGNLLLLVLGILLTVLGLLLLLIFGYGIYKGRLNLQKVLDEFERKLQTYQSK